VLDLLYNTLAVIDLSAVNLISTCSCHHSFYNTLPLCNLSSTRARSGPTRTEHMVCRRVTIHLR